MIRDSLIQVLEYQGGGYKPLMAFEAWRVAVLNFADELLPGNLNKMQRHNLTDEVFVLLKGRCILFLGEGQEGVEHIHAVDLQPGKVYNVRQGCWHTHTLSQDGSVLIVENDNTSAANSTMTTLTPEQTAEIVTLTQNTWQG